MMNSVDVSWPATRWQLSAPESAILLHGPDGRGPDALRAGLTELIARRVLRIVTEEQPGVFGLRRKRSWLCAGDQPAPTEPVLRALWETYQTAPTQLTGTGQPGVTIEDFARALQSRYGSADGFVRQVILPALVERGLYQYERYKILWIIPATRLVLTSEGRQARAELVNWLAIAETQFGGWAHDDVSQALAFLGFAGAAMFLVPSVFDDMALLTTQPEFGGSFVTDGGSEGIAGFDVGGFDLSQLSFDFDLSALDSFTSAFDTGPSTGGDSAGSDGGSSDSGGGFDSGSSDGGGGFD